MSIFYPSTESISDQLFVLKNGVVPWKPDIKSIHPERVFCNRITIEERLTYNGREPFSINGPTGGSIQLTAANGQWMRLAAAPNIPANFTLTFPNADGGAGGVLATDGSGQLYWRGVSSDIGDMIGGATANAILYTDSGGLLAQNANLTFASSTLTAPNLATATSGQLRLKDASTHFINIQAPTTTANYTLTLPNTAGSSGQQLTTNGSGTLSWSSPSFNIGGAVGGSTADALVFTSGGLSAQTASLTYASSILSAPNLTLAAAGKVRITDATTHTIDIQAASTSATYVITLPNSAGTNGQLLTTNGSGTLSWSTPYSLAVGGAITGSTANALLYTASGLITQNSGLTFASSTLTAPNLTLAAAGKIRLTDATTHTVDLKAASTSATYVLTLPNSAGTSGQQLTTDGSGTLSWAAPLSLGSTIASGTDNRILYQSGGLVAQDANLTFDNTTKVFAVQTTAPEAAAHVTGSTGPAISVTTSLLSTATTETSTTLGVIAEAVYEPTAPSGFGMSQEFGSGFNYPGGGGPNPLSYNLYNYVYDSGIYYVGGAVSVSPDIFSVPSGQYTVNLSYNDGAFTGQFLERVEYGGSYYRTQISGGSYTDTVFPDNGTTPASLSAFEPPNITSVNAYIGSGNLTGATYYQLYAQYSLGGYQFFSSYTSGSTDQPEQTYAAEVFWSLGSTPANYLLLRSFDGFGTVDSWVTFPHQGVYSVTDYGNGSVTYNGGGYGWNSGSGYTNTPTTITTPSNFQSSLNVYSYQATGNTYNYQLWSYVNVGTTYYSSAVGTGSYDGGGSGYFRWQLYWNEVGGVDGYALQRETNGSYFNTTAAHSPIYDLANWGSGQVSPVYMQNPSLPGNTSINTISVNSGGNYNTGTYYFRVFPYNSLNGGRVYSTTTSETSISVGMDSSYINIGWNDISVSGYKLLRSTDFGSNYDYEYDVGNTTNINDYNDSWTTPATTTDILPFYIANGPNQGYTGYNRVAAPSGQIYYTGAVGYSISQDYSSRLYLGRHTLTFNAGYRIDTTINGTAYQYESGSSPFYESPSFWSTPQQPVTPNHAGYSTGTMTYRIYTYRTIEGSTYYSSTYTQRAQAVVSYQYVNLNWNAVTGATGYKILRSTDGVNFTYSRNPGNVTSTTDDATDPNWVADSTVTPNVTPAIGMMITRPANSDTALPHLVLKSSLSTATAKVEYRDSNNNPFYAHRTDASSQQSSAGCTGAAFNFYNSATFSQIMATINNSGINFPRNVAASITHAGSTNQDLNISSTSGSVNISSGENVSDSIVINGISSSSGVLLKSANITELTIRPNGVVATSCLKIASANLFGFIRNTTPTTINTTGASSLIVNHLAQGIIVRSSQTSNVTDTLPAASSIGSSLVDVNVGDTIQFHCINTNATYTWTLGLGTNITDGGLTTQRTLATSGTATFLIRMTSSSTAVIYRV